MHWPSPQSCDRDASLNIGLEIRAQGRLRWPEQAGAEDTWDARKVREGGRDGQNETERKTLTGVLAANGCGCVRARARAWVGARVLALQNDGGPGAGLMRCFRDNASRRVDM